MDRLKGIICIFIFSMLSACSEVNSVQPFDAEQARVLIKENTVSQPSKQMVALKLPQEERWHKVSSSPRLLVPKGESTTTWQESIQTDALALINTPTMNSQQFAQEKFVEAKKNCEHVHATILSDSKHAVIYSLSQTDCTTERNQKQIAKVLQGQDAVYFIRYAAIDNSISSKQFNLMSKEIKKAYLVPNPRYGIKKP